MCVVPDMAVYLLDQQKAAFQTERDVESDLTRSRRTDAFETFIKAILTRKVCILQIIALRYNVLAYGATT